MAAILALLIVMGALVVVLTSTAPNVVATNSRVIVSASAVTLDQGTERCQGGEYVPEEAARLRVFPGSPLGRPTGEPLAISVFDSAGRAVTQASVPGGYRSSRPLDVPLRARERDVVPGSLCVRNLGTHPMSFARSLNSPIDRAGPGARPEGEIRVDYLRLGRRSWLTLSPDIARRFELFKPSFFGPWTMWATLAMVVAVGAIAVRLVLRSLPQRPPRRSPWLPAAGWACAGIAVANAAAWAVITPTFQVPDEPSHVGYARYLAAEGRPPPPPPPSQRFTELRPRTDHSDAYNIVYDHLPFNVEREMSWSVQQDRAMRRALDGDISRVSRWDAGWASNYPPLYYALQAVPARFGPGANLVDKMLPMRLVSALLAGVTVAFVYLFLRELLPSRPWAWVMGSLAVAFQPVFGFLAGGVNNDNLLFAAGAVLLFAIARGFRAGLTPRLGLFMGTAAAVGMLTKTTMLTMLPAAGLALGFLLWKARSSHRRPVVLGAIAAVTVFVGLTAGWYLVDAVVFGRAPGAATGLASAEVASRTSFRGQLSYLWQSFLPPLPFMAEQFPGYPHYLVWDHYIEGFIGRFGWFQYGFPLKVNQAGFAVLVGIAVLAIAALVRRRAVRRRWAELACYLFLVLSMLVVNGIVGYRFRAATGFYFEQPRYLFPALALYGAVVAIAPLGAGRRWGPAVAAFLSVVAVGHSLFAMLLTIGRYYA